MFWIELSVAAVIPTLLLFSSNIRRSAAGLMTVSIMSVSGIVLNRINVGGLTHIIRGDTVYLPAWTEVAITTAVIAGAALVFLYMVERFNIWELRPVDPEKNPKWLPAFHPVDNSWLGEPAIASRTKYSLGFIIAAAMGFALISGEPASSRGVERTPVQKARGGQDMLWIDGNFDGYGVRFDHRKHTIVNGCSESCVKCHHMNLPRDVNSGCYNCHQDMYLSTDAFKHEWHASSSGANLSCSECHSDSPRGSESAKSCDKCHKDLIPPNSVIEVKQYGAICYTEAMHTLCVGCHTQVAVKDSVVNDSCDYDDHLDMANTNNLTESDRKNLPRCATCHREQIGTVDDPELASHRAEMISKRQVLPPIYRHETYE
ncbi:cytochrome c3 family protein [Calditrichota bacterium]